MDTRVSEVKCRYHIYIHIYQEGRKRGGKGERERGREGIE